MATQSQRPALIDGPIRRHGDVSFFPGSPEDAFRIRTTGLLEPEPPKYPPPHNPTGFNLADLKAPAILQVPIEVPSHDPRGHPCAVNFESWKRIKECSVGIASNTFSHKGHGRVACLSNLERIGLSHFEMNPHVLEIRSQYPEWDRGKFTQRLVRGDNIPKNDVMTIDFVLTIKIPGSSRLHYHGISFKPYKDLELEKNPERHERERKILGLWGATHEIMTEHTFSEKEDVNNQRLFQYMLHVTDINRYAKLAKDFAKRLLSSTAKGTYDRVITMNAKAMRQSRDEGYRLYALAHFLGYLRFDHRNDLLPESPFGETREDGFPTLKYRLYH